MIAGVMLTPLKRVAHPKGDILHAVRADGPGFAGFGEAYFSHIAQHAIKGWKRHNRLNLNIVVPVGQIRFVLVDQRSGSVTEGQVQQVSIGADHYARLTVPAGLWVAFQGEAPFNLLLNVIAEPHDPAESDNIDLDAIAFPW